MKPFTGKFLYLCTRFVGTALRLSGWALILSIVPFFANANVPYADTQSNRDIDTALLGSVPIKNFNVEKFDGTGTNWYVNQDSEGTIFLSNTVGLYQYDGSQWRLILAKAQIRQFTFGSDGRIFIGGQTDFGYLEKISFESYQYHSLKPLLKGKSTFSAVNNVYYLEGKVYFITPEQIIVFQQGKLDFIRPENKFSRAWLCEAHLFFNDGHQLKSLNKGKITLMTGFEKLGIRSFSFVRKNSGGSGYIIGTFSDGIYLWDKGKVSALISRNNPLAARGFYNSINLDNEHYAVSTIRDGVYFFKRPATPVYHLNNKNGLASNIAVNLFLDQQQGLWIPQEGALSRSHLPFELTILKAPQFSLAKINSIAELDNKLYLAAVNGVASLDSGGKLEFHDELITSVSRIRKFKDSLLISGARKCLIWTPETSEVKIILETPSCWDLIYSSKDQNTVIILNEQGILMSQKAGENWSKPTFLFKEDRINSALVEDNKGNIWTSTSKGELLRIYKDNIWKAQKIHVAQEAITAMSLWGNLIIGTDEGLFQWDYSHHRLGKSFTWFEKQFGKGTPAPEIIQIDNHNRLWIGGQKDSGFFQIKDGKVTSWHSKEVSLAGLHNLRNVFDTDSATWVSFNDGLMRLGNHKNKSKFNVELIVTGLRDNKKNFNFSGNINSYKTQELMSPKSRIRISWSLKNYIANDQTRYRYQMDNGTWSDWQQKTNQDFETLGGGHHDFKVEAQDFNGNIYHSKILNFEVAYIWYQTWWAYTGMILLLLLITIFTGFGISYYRTRKLLSQKLELETQVRERTKTIQKQALQLRKKDEIKSRFFANVSHDFRTPLTLTIGPLKDLLKDSAMLADKMKQNIEVALENSKYMLALVGQILDINRLENNMMIPAIDKIEAVQFINDLLGRFTLAGKQRHLRILFNTDLESQTLYFDPDHLNKIITNLLSNAIKFSPVEGEIKLELKQIGNKLIISVSDQGPGINPEDRLHIFDRYYQGQESSEATHPGTGIGLALVKELLSLHQGEITLDPDYKNGSCFILSLLLGKEHYQQALMVTSPHRHEDEEWSGLIPHLTHEQQSQTISEESLHLDIRPTVLIVDDNPEIRDYVRDAIESRYKVVQADNGIRALAIVSETNPDFVISDVMMPEMDGLELTKTLKSDRQTAHIPLLLLTAKSTKRDTVEGLQEGADDYLTKPFDRSELIARIEAHLQQKQNIARAIYDEYILGNPEELVHSNNPGFKHQFHRHIIENLSSAELDVSMMADAMHMDRSTLFRQAKKHFGCTPVQYLKQQRLRKALGMLKQQRGTISEIAYAVGFQSLNYFSRTFKLEYHCLPSNFKQISEMGY